MPEATVETAEPKSGEAVKVMVAVKNGHVAAKVDCSSEEWVTLAAHNLEARCAPFAIEHSPFWILLVQSAPYLHLQGGPASAPHNHPSHHPPCRQRNLLEAGYIDKLVSPGLIGLDRHRH